METLWLSSAACEMFDLASVGRHNALVTSDFFGEWIDVIEDAWRNGLETVTFATSGSTGSPKRCTHKLVDLCAEASCFADLYEDRLRILAFVPAHHIYGFIFTALLPDLLHIDCLDVDLATEALGSLQRGDLILGFPERWQWIERVVRRFGADVRGVTSTAPCPRDLIETLTGAGLAGMTEVYGSSETAGIGVRRWPENFYRLLPRWTFACEDGVTIVDATGFRTALPDAIQRVGEDAFFPTGRLDAAVQVGGVNVYPELVAAALRERPGVEEAAVRLMPPSEGSRLKAFIVPDGSMSEATLNISLRQWLADTMEAAACPTDLRYGTQLPRNALGKLADW